MRLLTVELRRAYHRRANRVIMGTLALLFVVIGVVAVIRVGDLPPLKTITEADGLVHVSNRDFDGTVQIIGNEAHFTRQFKGHSHLGKPDGPPDMFTNDLKPGDKIITEGKPGHQQVDFNFPNQSLARFSDMFNHRNVDGASVNVPAMLALFGCLLAGASMVGAEWKWNTFASLLTWEPRRLRLLGSRFVASFILGILATALLTIFFVICALPTVWIHGSMTGVDSHWWSFALEALLRISVIGGLGAVGGSALAMIGRNTVAAMMTMAVYLLILENIIVHLRPTWWPLAYGRIVPALIGWQKTHVELSTVSPRGAAVSVAILLAALVTLAMVSFAKRDVAAS